MTAEIKSSEIVFFLGAGASVDAGVPDTFSFVDEYISSIEETDKKETIKKIVETLEKWKGTKIDVELLLETLTKLKNKEDEPLLRFYSGGDFILKGYYEKGPLIDDLKDFIKRKAIVPGKKIQYFQPLIGFIEEFRPLNIISVNYDICIEQFCNVHKLAYQDGFDVHWNPKTFTSEHTDIRLYKLHGSVMWYQSDRGGYIKLPVMTEESKIQLITGEKAENLMLYPMQKWDYAEPLLEMLVEIKHLLESETCKFLIIVGYSFRDDHIRRILWDAARKNRDLHLILISPNAYQIYFKRLKYYDNEHKIPSSLEGKVVCLPYLFEGVFPHLKNHYLVNLKVGLSSEKVQHQAEIQGQKADWIYYIKHFVNAEYIEKVEAILQKNIFERGRDWSLSLELPLKMAINLSISGQKEKADRYFGEFNEQLFKMAVDGFHVQIIKNPPSHDIEVNFNYQRHESGGSHIGWEQFKGIIEPLSEFCDARTRFVSHVNSDFQETNEKLKKLKHYLESFKKGRIEFESYIKIRQDKISNIKQFRKEYEMLQKDSQLRNLDSIIIEVEKSILKEIIKEPSIPSGR